MYSKQLPGALERSQEKYVEMLCLICFIQAYCLEVLFSCLVTGQELSLLYG